MAAFSGFSSRNNYSSFRGVAKRRARNPYPPAVVMDSGPAPYGASRNDDGGYAGHVPLTQVLQRRLDSRTLFGHQRRLRRHGIADLVALHRQARLDAGGEIEAREGFIDAPEFSL